MAGGECGASVNREGVLAYGVAVPQGITPKNVFRHVLSAFQPGEFQAYCTNSLSPLRGKAASASGITQPVLAIEGKTLRRNHHRVRRPGESHSSSIGTAGYRWG